MQFTHSQKQHLYENGYIHVPGVVPRIRLDAALRAINHGVGQGIDPAQLPKYRAQSYVPEVSGTPPITDLLMGTPAWELAESLIGAEQVLPVRGGQIALRFPGFQDPLALPRAHIDGLPTATNGVSLGTLGSFTLLLGVLLSDLPETNAGNFTVWPGSHRVLEKHLQEVGTDGLLNGGGMPDVPLGEAQQITGKAGDMVLCHFQLAHGIAPNVSANIRYAVFFRLFHKDHAAHKQASLTDIWLAWPGMRDFKGEAD
jgi:ectoine hydroxylase-related dioxygenase (phytanoyl-CoA dioxygenase family)